MCGFFVGIFHVCGIAGVCVVMDQWSIMHVYVCVVHSVHVCVVNW